MSEKSKTVAEKMAELQGLLEWFDGEDFTLEQAIGKFKEAQKLSEAIESDLTNLKNEIEVVKQDFGLANES